MDAGIGEMALLGAVVGGGMSAAQGKNPLQGALLGGVLGGIGGAAFPEALGLGDATAAVNSTQAAGVAGEAALNDSVSSGLASLPSNSIDQETIDKELDGLLNYEILNKSTTSNEIYASPFSTKSRSSLVTTTLLYHFAKVVIC